MDSAKFSFPAVKGIQANMEYYVTMIPLDCIPKLFTFSDENLAPEIRSQRTLNRSRIPEMSNYILQNLLLLMVNLVSSQQVKTTHHLECFP